MQVLKRFSEKEQDYHLYQSRQNVLREEQSRQALLDETTKELGETTKELGEATKELDRLRALLKKSGIDPSL